MTLRVDITCQLDDFQLTADFTAPEGVTVLFGKSGSGKTSIVKSVAGLINPVRGKIDLIGRTLFDSTSAVNIPTHQRRMGYVFQEGRLFPHLTVRQNLTYASRAGRRGHANTDHVVDLLGLQDLLHRRPGGLSGGEAQRVAIGRALLSDPDMLLMDEPLAALDAPRKADILPYLDRLCQETRLPILYVTHNMAEVARLATHIVLIDNGRVKKSGTPSEVLTDPDMVRAVGIRDAGAVLAAKVMAQPGDGVTELEVSGGRLFLPQIEAPIGTALRVRILAQDVLLSTQKPQNISALNILPVTVLALRRGEGPGVIAQLQAGQDRLLARITRRSADALQLEPGTSCYAVMKSVAVAQTDIAQGLQSGP